MFRYFFLIKQIRNRGGDYEALLANHNLQSTNRNRIVECLKKRGVDVKLVHRFEYTSELIDWADVVFTAGGDGTFLMAASKINDRNKPLIGINSDPPRSVGYLCIPSKYTDDIDGALDKLLSGQFEWKYRQRIRVTVEGENALDEPLEIHNQMYNSVCPENRFLDLEPCTNIKSDQQLQQEINGHHVKKQTIPIRALNEVFVGESLSSRVSSYELAINDDTLTRVKSSGIVIGTGTGSTSWSFNMNKVTNSCVKSLIQIVNQEAGTSINATDDLISCITKRFNDSLIFDPETAKMAYSIRDPIVFNTDFNGKNPRGFADTIKIKSRMFDATIVLDGGLSYKFNDGSIALFECKLEDALKTVQLD